MSGQNGNTSEVPRVVFVSYRVVDNDPPPDSPNQGFVDYVLKDVRYDLTQFGVPNAILWQDRAQIASGDNWNNEILNALNKAELFVAILSLNYITSRWCAKEIKIMSSRVKMLGAPALARIFRVDKHKVPENKIPKPLRLIQSIRFYGEDRYSGKVYDFFWRGKVRFVDEYEEAVKNLARSICKRLEDLGIPSNAPPEPRIRHSRKSNGGALNARQSNGRVIFVAKPAGDMVPSYRALVTELSHAGYRVTPDPDEDLGDLGKQVRSAVVKALGEAEVAVHLIGTSDGGRPKGLGMAFVPMQLAAAAHEAKSREAKRRPGFERMIWAPSVLPSETSPKPRMIRRDPLQVLGQFGQKLLQNDQIEGDTASRFNELVFQRLTKNQVRKARSKET